MFPLIRVSIVLVFAMLAVLPVTGQAAAEDLIDAIQDALQTHPRLQEERANLRAAREALPIALAPYRPQISLQATTGHSDRRAVLADNSEIDDETSPSTYSLNASQLIWSSGRRSIAQRRGILEVRLAEARYAAAERAIILDVSAAFLDLQFREDSLQIETQTRDGLFEQSRAVETRFERGQATRTDIAQIAARLADAQARVAAAQANLTTARARFERQTGLPPEAPRWSDINLPNWDIEDLQQSVRDNSHEIAAARIEAELARLNLMDAQRANSPTVSLGLQRNESEDVSPAVTEDDETRLSLSLNVPLMRGGENRARRRQAVAYRSAARHALRDQEAEMDLVTIDAWARLLAARASMRAQEERLRAAETALEGVTRGQSAGLWTTPDVLDATEETLRARLSLAEARNAWRSATVELALMTGELVY